MSLLFIKFILTLAFPSGGRGTAIAVDEVFFRLRTAISATHDVRAKLSLPQWWELPSLRERVDALLCSGRGDHWSPTNGG